MLLRLEIIVEKRCLSLLSNLLEFVTVFEMSKLSMCLYVVMSEKCRLYSVENHEMGTKAQPMFLSVIVNMMSLFFCRVIM